MARAKQVGDQGEQVVEAWLQGQGWQTLARRWRCPWGELDLVMYREPVLSFVEVKTRASGSWDQGGRLAVTGQKQQRLIRAAQAFLGTYPQWSETVCRFDVALVQGGEVRDYLEHAFELSA
ncbi:MAG: YraN family protein [Thermostichales cyanobacterium SZTDM-1c_bins_54]